MVEVQAEIAANVWQVPAEEGQMIAEGETIAILESMKMEIPVEAPVSGTVTEIRVKPEDHDARVLVLTGAGGHFCAGADLGGVEGEHFVEALRNLLLSLTSASQPVLAAVDGAALGAGTQLAVACDLRMATPAAKFGIPA